MNLLNKKWIKYKNNNVKIHKENGRLIIENNSNRHGFVCCTHIFKKQDDYDVKLNFEGKVLNGEAALLTVLNRKREILYKEILDTPFRSMQHIKYIDNKEKTIISKLYFFIDYKYNTLF